jgi:hypothetical protein
MTALKESFAGRRLCPGSSETKPFHNLSPLVSAKTAKKVASTRTVTS